MDLKQLKERGGVISTELVERSVTWTHTVDGEEVNDTFTVFVRRLAFGAIEKMINAGIADRSRTAELIAASIRLGENGKDAISYEDAYNLEPSLARVLAETLSEVNELGK